MEFGEVQLPKSSPRVPTLEFGLGKYAVEVE